MRAVLIGSAIRVAPQCLRDFALKPHDLRIAVDGGLAIWLSLGLQPDLAVGDWDSVRMSTKVLQQKLASIAHITLPQMKDRSDLYYALQTAVALGVTSLVCFGVTGGHRADHHLASLFEMFRLLKTQRQVKSLQCWDSKNQLILLSPQCPRFRGGKRGEVLSLFAWMGDVSGLSLKGVKYGFPASGKDHRLQTALYGSSQGLSNEITGMSAEVSLQSGQLLVMVSKPERRPASL